MTRLAVTVDRLAALLVGIALIALGAALVGWNTNLLPNIPRTINAPGLRAATSTGWWPWALAGVGIVLVVIALRWLLTHKPAARVKSLPLQTGDEGSITIDLGEVASAAGHSLEQSIGIESASGKAVIDRGTRTVDLSVKIAPTTRANRVIAPIDATCAQVAGMIDQPTVATRTIIHVQKKTRQSSRVR